MPPVEPSCLDALALRPLTSVPQLLLVLRREPLKWTHREALALHGLPSILPGRVPLRIVDSVLLPDPRLVVLTPFPLVPMPQHTLSRQAVEDIQLFIRRFAAQPVNDRFGHPGLNRGELPVSSVRQARVEQRFYNLFGYALDVHGRVLPRVHDYCDGMSLKDQEVTLMSNDRTLHSASRKAFRVR